MRETALGVLGWSPDVFWQSVPRDLYAAVGGRMKTMPKRSGSGIDRETFDELVKLRAADERGTP